MDPGAVRFVLPQPRGKQAANSSLPNVPFISRTPRSTSTRADSHAVRLENSWNLVSEATPAELEKTVITTRT